MVPGAGCQSSGNFLGPGTEIGGVQLDMSCLIVSVLFKWSDFGRLPVSGVVGKPSAGVFTGLWGILLVMCMVLPENAPCASMIGVDHISPLMRNSLMALSYRIRPSEKRSIMWVLRTIQLVGLSNKNTNMASESGPSIARIVSLGMTQNVPPSWTSLLISVFSTGTFFPFFWLSYRGIMPVFTGAAQ